jgi:hypothetical protein
MSLESERRARYSLRLARSKVRVSSVADTQDQFERIRAVSRS